MAIAIDYLIRSIIKRYFAEGKPDKIRTAGVDEIKAAIKREGGLWKDYKSKIYPLTQEISNEINRSFIQTNSAKLSIIDQQSFTTILQRLEKNTNGRGEEIYKTMRRAVAKSTELDKPWQEVAREMLRKIKLEDHYIQTEINTAENALDNLARFQSYKRTGIEKLQYDGPLPEREFCTIHYQKIYTLEEVQAMVNDFGEPAYTFCGGYNCRHRWNPII